MLNFSSRALFTLVAAAGVLACLCTGAAAQSPLHPVNAATGQADSDAGVDVEEAIARDSPRASMMNFIALCHRGDYEGASQYLELAAADKDLGPDLAKRLKAVLDRKAWIDVDKLSPLPTGNTDDGLSGYTDEVGQIAGVDGIPQPVRIVRRKRDTVRWVFSNATVSRVDGWYEQLDDRWVLEKLPEPLLRTGPRELMYWQWLALPLLVLVSLLAGMVLSRVGTIVLSKLASRSKTTWDDAMVARLQRPATVWWMLAVAYCLLPFLALYEPAEKFVLSTMHTVFLFGLFWALVKIVDIGAEVVFRSPWAGTRAAATSLVSLGARVAKVAVIAIAGVALLSQLGYPIASILAGLGVGGLAVALAAQKTVENLFGAFSIGADQPFREGDFVKVDDFTATVEQIGLRSTKFRTGDRTIISIPNGKLADMKLETYAVRDRLRFALNVALVRSTTVDQIKQISEGIEAALNAHPKLWQKSASVRFGNFGIASLDLTVEAYFNTRDAGEYALIRQDMLMQFLSIIERAGTSLALPTTDTQPVLSRRQSKADDVRPS
ncbi:MAG: hypothetical protein JWN48_5455 [Myxococcaceae bacterium]|nr:hypothetical protein [Myxococcaceae bacterium]